MGGKGCENSKVEENRNQIGCQKVLVNLILIPQRHGMEGPSTTVTKTQEVNMMGNITITIH